MDPGTQSEASEDDDDPTIAANLSLVNCSNAAIASTMDVQTRLDQEAKLASATDSKLHSLALTSIERFRMLYAAPLRFGRDSVRFGLSPQRRLRANSAS
jgi:hypothetical protein